MNYWLMKSEPEAYSIDDLSRDEVTAWSGVRNYQARNFMRDDMRVGDGVLFYASNAKPSGVVGVARVASAAYADPTQFDPSSKYFDPKATSENPRWFLVDIAFVRKLAKPITLAGLKLDPSFSTMAVVQKGSRLSITPVLQKHFERLIAY